MLCRSDVAFVDKMDQFIRRAQSVDNKPSDLTQNILLSDAFNFNRLRRSLHQPSKGQSKDMPPESFDVDEPAIKGGGRPRRLLVHAKMLFVSISFLPLLGRLCFGRFYIFTEQMGF